MTNWDKLLSKAEIANAKKERKKEYLEKTIWRSALEDEQREGWQYFKDTKKPERIKVRKDKPRDEIFENRVWVLLASMGFENLNRDRHFCINYSQKRGEDLTKQIDVFAADEETVLVVECKCAENPETNRQWKTELEAINGYQNAVRSMIQKKFPNHNVKFIFATKNYIVGKLDKERMEEFQIAYFDEKTIVYYEELAKHLGSASRYQLLGFLFAGQTIGSRENLIPAIQGKMGGNTYYAFSIQPETLLKIGYVLHRSEANDDMLPTYQRIIKKARLQSVHKFIENGGFFPNSIVISIDAKKTLQFDLSSLQGTDEVAKLGVLHLPNRYRSAYIIDGQHRIYGYSDSKYAQTNSVPVVAFENMKQEEQVKLFMEINENQKAVSKNLRNTLTSDLLWFSDSQSEKREAIRSRLAQDLGENPSSPLYKRVIIGEDQADDFKCITLEYICQALASTNMLTRFKKDGTPEAYGVFDLDSNEKTLELLEKYVFGCFDYLKEIVPKEWEIKKPKQESILLFNNAVHGLILLFGDIANILQEKGNAPREIESFLEKTHYYLDPIEDYINKLSDEEKKDLRSSYGTAGPRYFWRTMQKAVHEAHSEFCPEGYVKYWEDHGTTYNEDSLNIMRRAERIVREFVRTTLVNNCTQNGENWDQQIPRKIYTDASAEASKKKYDTGVESEIWEFFTMGSLQAIVTYGNNWMSLFEDALTLPSLQNKKVKKGVKTEWMSTIDKLQRAAGHSNFAVSKSDYETLKEVESILPDLEENTPYN